MYSASISVTYNQKECTFKQLADDACSLRSGKPDSSWRTGSQAQKLWGTSPGEWVRVPQSWPRPWTLPAPPLPGGLGQRAAWREPGLWVFPLERHHLNRYTAVVPTKQMFGCLRTPGSKGVSSEATSMYAYSYQS